MLFNLVVVNFCYTLTAIVAVVGGLQVNLPSTLTVFELQVVNVTCNATDYPNGTALTYVWTKDAIPSFYLSAQSLILSPIDTDEDGVYRCTATMATTGTSASASVDIIVQYSPRWNMDTVTKFAGVVGQTGQLVCSTHAYPTPQFYWQDTQGNNITASSAYSVVTDGVNSTLSISNVQQSSYGSYTCVAVNVAGPGRFLLTLQAPGVPDSPLLCTVNAIGSANVQLSCISGFDGGQSVTFPIYKVTVGSSVETQSSSSTDADGVVSIDVDGLSGGTNYTLLVYARNQYGQSDESFAIDVSTLPGGASSNERLAIIVGPSVGGGVFIIVLVSIVACCCIRRCRRRKGDENKENQFQGKLSNDYAAEQSNPSQVCRRGGSGRKKSGLSSSGPFRRNEDDGLTNGHQRATTSNAGPSVLNLNHNPGESCDGFQNRAYDVDEGGEGGRQRESKKPGSQPARGQLLLSGHGAIDGIVEMNTFESNNAGSHNRMSDFYDRESGAYGKASNSHGQVAPPIIPHDRESKLYGKAPNSHERSTVSSRQIAVPFSTSSKPCSVPSVPFQPDLLWEFPREKLYVRHKLGEGAYGEVWQAKAEGLLGRPGQRTVAVKVLRDDHGPEEVHWLRKDIEVMKRLQPHPNVLLLLGCCSRSNPPCMILELATNGSLLSWLRLQRNALILDEDKPKAAHRQRQQQVNPTTKDLTIFGLHVASGMDYISSNQLLHRDLATRNVLLDEQLTCKVSDFGTAEDIVDMRQYESRVKRRLPLRWMSPESLMMSEYTVKTDVWSFGVLLWEIMTLGSTPYPGMNGPQVLEFVQKGGSMTKPRCCSEAVYDLMKFCWMYYPTKRPPFSLLQEQLALLVGRKSADRGEEIFIDQMSENAFEILQSQSGEKC